jgi:hypothetical protein
MNEAKIEAILASPPERDELVVQLFTKGGGQWGEVYRFEDSFWIDLYTSEPTPLRFKLNSFVEALSRSKTALSERLEER